MAIVSHPANDRYRDRFDETFGRKEDPPLRADMGDGDFPRRNRMDLWTPAERAIHDVVQLVESLGAHPLLTEASMLLQQAQNKVADFVEHDR